MEEEGVVQCRTTLKPLQLSAVTFGLVLQQGKFSRPEIPAKLSHAFVGERLQQPSTIHG